MIVKVSIVTMKTKSMGDNLQGLQQERKDKKRNIWRDTYVCHFLPFPRIVTGVNITIF